MRHGDEGAVRGLDPHDDVRRGEVCEQLPVSGETMEPLHVSVGQEALSVNEITER